MQSGNGMAGGGFPRVDNRVSIKLGLKSKKERSELRRQLEAELNLVRAMARKLERSSGGGNGVGKLKRVHSEVGSIGWVDKTSVVVPEVSQGTSDNVEKEKRTPKANQFYQSSDFVLGKEKIQGSDHGKKVKGGKKNGDCEGSGFGTEGSLSKVFKSCSLLLKKLMVHKHGWVFNEPVNVKTLGLHDYFTIIKHPMDLGTVKSRLATNWYKSPKEFAEDVRLTFSNAMTYNPKGHDVYAMADILLKMFEEKWPSIEAEYMRELKAAADSEPSLHTPTSKKVTPPPPLPPPVQPPVETVTDPATVRPKTTQLTPTGRNPIPKKPKAKDAHKRDMTYVEKQKLSTDLQDLPSEKLDHVVQIIRKRNPSLCQNDDEIEVDIDSVDNETLWELDRFVMNYKKNLSKVKKKTDVVDANEGNAPEKNEAPSLLEEPKESKAEEKTACTAPPVQHENQGGNATKSNSSRSSSSDSGSSSSETESDSSSA